jgi:hypothetical protein
MRWVISCFPKTRRNWNWEENLEEKGLDGFFIVEK